MFVAMMVAPMTVEVLHATEVTVLDGADVSVDGAPREPDRVFDVALPAPDHPSRRGGFVDVRVEASLDGYVQMPDSVVWRVPTGARGGLPASGPAHASPVDTNPVRASPALASPHPAHAVWCRWR